MNTRNFTRVELEFMQIIWDQPGISVPEIRERLADTDHLLTEGAIRRILAILMEKGHLNRVRNGRQYLYSATMDRPVAEKSMVGDLLQRGFGDSISDMVASLLDCRDVDKGELDEIKRIIERHEKDTGS